MAKKFVLFALAFALASCGKIVVPPLDCRTLGCPSGSHCAMDDSVIPATYKCVPDEPTPPPETKCPEVCGHGTRCTDPAVGCVPIPAPGLVCNPGDTCGCWVFPADEPDWRELACAEREGFTNTCVDNLCVYVEVPEPGPAGCIDERKLEPASPQPAGPDPDNAKAIKRAIAELGPALPDPRANLDNLAAKLTSYGLCVISGDEAIFLRRADYLVDEFHAVFFGTGSGWTNNGAGKWIGAHTDGTTPPVGDACPFAPCPERLYPDGRPHWKYNAKQHTMGNGDSTPVVINQLDYCRKIGLGDFNGTPRASCPVRPDRHPERVAVEAWLLEGGPTRDSRNGQDCAPNHTDNPAAFLFGTGNCRMCNRPKTVCSAWL